MQFIDKSIFILSPDTLYIEKPLLSRWIFAILRLYFTSTKQFFDEQS